MSSVGHAQAEGSAFDTAKLHPKLLKEKTPLTDPLKKQLKAPYGSYLWFKQVEDRFLDEAWQEAAAAPQPDAAAGEAGDADDGDLDWLLAEPQEGEPARPTPNGMRPSAATCGSSRWRRGAQDAKEGGTLAALW